MKNLLLTSFTFIFLITISSCGKDDDVVPTCADGILNGMETGVDCGGDCNPCAILGCTDPTAHNYNSTATQNDGSCMTCSDGIQNGNETEVDCGGSCAPCVSLGCTDPTAHNYNPEATQNDGSCETCSDGVYNGDETGLDCGGSTCESCPTIGESGPAGGLIFHDKGNYSNGWRYLEYGIEIQNGDKQWGCFNLNNTSLTLGSGFENTNNVINNYNNGTCSQSPDAFLACANLSRNGHNDWYLPSVNELHHLYTVRSQIGLGGKRFWSSTELDTHLAYIVDFGGAQDGVPHTYSWTKVPGNGQGLGAVVAIRRF